MESYYDIIEGVLENYSIKSTNEAKNIIKSNIPYPAIDKGNLLNDLKVDIKILNGIIAVELVAPPYAKYVNYGVKGSKSSARAPDSPFQYKKKLIPRGVIDRWIVRKNIKGSRDAKGRFMSRWFLNLLIRKSINAKGLKAVNFIQPFYDNLEWMQRDLAREIGDELAQNLVKNLENLKIV
tara:strand:- start:190 stop:729 length:540 start_codon:yes stop_codon:yes gene_type:complete